MKQDKRITIANRKILRDKELLGWFGQVELKEALKPVIQETIEIIDTLPPKLQDLNDKVELLGGDTWVVLTLAKNDLSPYLSEKQIIKLSDSDMSIIAEKLANSLMESYWISLEVILENWKDNN